MVVRSTQPSAVFSSLYHWRRWCLSMWCSCLYKSNQQYPEQCPPLLFQFKLSKTFYPMSPLWLVTTCALPNWLCANFARTWYSWYFVFCWILWLTAPRWHSHSYASHRGPAATHEPSPIGRGQTQRLSTCQPNDARALLIMAWQSQSRSQSKSQSSLHFSNDLISGHFVELLKP